MSLRIAVCIKPVPDPEQYHKIQIHPDTKTIVREGIESIINPIDKHAIEEGLRLREAHGGTVMLFSMAPPDASQNLLEALAMGADEAYLLSDKRFAGADTLATSHVLAAGIQKAGGADLIITGTESGDGATAQVPAQLGEWLGIDHLWGVTECHIESPESVELRTKTEDGAKIWTAQLPLAIAVAREINQPRFTSIMGVMKAKKKPLETWGYEDLDVDEQYVGLAGSPTQPGDIYTMDISRKGEIIQGSGEEVVHLILDQLRKQGVTLPQDKQ